MTSPGTELDPATILAIANAHIETAGDIEKQRTAFNQAVESLSAACNGRMIDALEKARESWEAQLNDTIGDLNVMAENVQSSVGAITSQDDENSSKVDNVGVGILAGL